MKQYPVYMVEDGRAASIDQFDQASELEIFGSWYTYRNLMTWKNCDAHLVRYQGNERQYIAPVDDILNGKVRPPVEVLDAREQVPS